jgi:membrane protease YdiL (CAAX protease family)
MNIGMILNLGWGPAALLLLALPALRTPRHARWVALAIGISVADSIATLLPFLYRPLVLPHMHYNWTGKLIDIAVMVTIMLVLVASGAFKRTDFAFTLKQAPGTRRGLLLVVLPFLIIVALLAATLFGNPKPPSTETVLFEATLPGLAEELVWRGLLLALFDRMFAGRVTILGAALGYSAIATSLVFGFVHSVQFDSKLVLHTAFDNGAFAAVTGLVLVWIRARTKSLVFPVLTHNATNLILESVPLLS